MKNILNIKQALLTLSVCFCFLGSAQNLVPNNSFEILDSCHTSLSQNNCTASYASQWGCLANSSADIYLACNGTVPYPPNEIPSAQDGGNFVGILCYEKYVPNEREYISIKLSTTLIQYQAYRVGYYVYLAPTMGDFFEIRNMNAALADTFIYNGPDFGVLPYTPQIVNQLNNPLNNSNGWAMVCDTFFAQGNEKYIAIGNFFNDSTTIPITSGISNGFPDSSAYYYIDNVFVEEIPGMIGIKENITKTPDIKLFPNPNTGEFTIEQNEGLAADLQIFDINGKLAGKYTLKGLSNTIKPEYLENGVYFYTISIGTKVLKRDKIVIIH